MQLERGEQMLKDILERRSIRQYTGDAVSRDQLTELVRAGMSAPSSRDTRHFRFIAVDDFCRDSAIIGGVALLEDASDRQACHYCGQ